MNQSPTPTWWRSHFGTRIAFALIAVAVIGAGAVLMATLPGAPPESTEPVVRGYSVSPTEIGPVTEQLNRRFGDVDGVRIAVDSRTRQILVVAPPSVHSEIDGMLAPNREPQVSTPSQVPGLSARQPTRPPERATNVAVVATQGTSERELKHIDTPQLERKLSGLWGGRMPASTSDDRNVLTVPLVAANGQPAALSIDRRQGRVRVTGPDTLRRSWMRLLDAFDRRPPSESDRTEVLPLHYARRDQVRYALTALQTMAPTVRTTSRDGTLAAGEALTMLAQPPDDPGAAGAPAGDATDNAGAADAAAGAGAADAGAGGAADAAAAAGAGQGVGESADMIGPVQIELLDGLDVIVVRGHRRDVERIVAIIEQIERLSAETEPVIIVRPLGHVESAVLTEMVTVLYEQNLAARNGRVSITALVKPNAILLIGRPAAVDAATELITQLDQPVGPKTQFKVFPLRHAAVLEVEETINQFYQERGGLGVRATIIADYRSNALIVHASPRDMVEIEDLVLGIDVGDTDAANELRVFRLGNSLADELAPVIQEAINGQTTGAGGAGGQAGTATNRSQQLRSTVLSFMAIDATGGRLLKSGILTDVRVTADARANALVVRGPAESMPLVAALIEQLDGLPSAIAQIKVFNIVNGDALSLAEMLGELFEEQGAGGLPVLQTVGGESSLVPMRFTVDQRTNTIIASGNAGDLAVVEAILLRLDASDVSQRKSTVYRLRNAPAIDVATSINELLRSERDIQQIAPEQISPFMQIEREVVVVPEPVTNSLIISATPRYYDEILEIVEELDKRPPMVVIQVLLAAVRLGNLHEVGMELGLQDSLLFNRSLGLGTDALMTPGFLFNNLDLGNSGSTDSLASREFLAGQALSSFGLDRTNADTEYGGLVLSASNESISVLVRALQECRRLEVLSRPQVMTLDNQSAFVQVGQRVPRITSVQFPTGGGTISNTELEDTGILLGVTPRISPDGLVVMEIDAQRSQLSDEPGIPIATGADGTPILSPITDIVLAQTTVSARNGQTVILGGLITTDSVVINRKVPLLGDIPIAGHLFRYDTTEEERNELLIIMTPHIIEDETDAELIKQVETQRMSWCLADVVNVHGEGVVSGSAGGWNQSWDEGSAEVIYPDRQPTAPPTAPTREQLPTPAAPPMQIAPPATGQSRSDGNPHGVPLPVAAEGARPLEAVPNGASASDVRFRNATHGQTGTNAFVRPDSTDRPPPQAPANPVVPAWHDADSRSRATPARFVPAPATNGSAESWRQRVATVPYTEMIPRGRAYGEYPEMRRLPSDPTNAEPVRTSRYSGWQETYPR